MHNLSKELDALNLIETLNIYYNTYETDKKKAKEIWKYLKYNFPNEIN